MVYAIKPEIKLGGRFSFEMGWDGTITKIDKLNSIRFDVDGTEGAYLEFIIEKTDYGCLFKLIDKMGDQQDASKIFPEGPDYQKYQPGGIGTHWSGVIAGYHFFVDNLLAIFTGKEPRKHSISYADKSRQYMGLLDDWHGIEK